MSDETRGGLAALERRALVDPETPFLFFRSPRGTITWWSFARAAQAALGAGDTASPGATLEDAFAAPREFLALVAAARGEELACAEAIGEIVRRSGAREIWISARPLDRPQERALALAATLGGWAVLREPGQALATATFLWARPTLLSGTGNELASLWRGVGAEAPRWRRTHWLERRLDRLSAVLVEPDGTAGSTSDAARALAALGSCREPRFLPFPEGGW